MKDHYQNKRKIMIMKVQNTKKMIILIQIDLRRLVITIIQDVKAVHLQTNVKAINIQNIKIKFCIN